MIKGEDIVSEARKWLDVPYRHQGRSVAGTDCVGLIIKVMQGLAASGFPIVGENNTSVSDYDYGAYARIPNGVSLMKEVSRMLTRVPTREMRMGDILLMRFRKDPQHLAIRSDLGIIHSHMDAGKVVEVNLNSRWTSRIISVHRFKELSSG